MSDGAQEAELLRRAGAGEEAAFLLLYERHRTPVFRFACRLLGSAPLAEDVTQECFLAVLKRHRPDSFLMSHAVDGYSLALDFPVNRGQRGKLWSLVRALAEPVVAAGGRFYPAKDAALPRDLYRSTFREGQLSRFAGIKAKLDPDRVLRSGLADRLIYED